MDDSLHHAVHAGQPHQRELDVQVGRHVVLCDDEVPATHGVRYAARPMRVGREGEAMRTAGAWQAAVHVRQRCAIVGCRAEARASAGAEDARRGSSSGALTGTGKRRDWSTEAWQVHKWSFRTAQAMRCGQHGAHLGVVCCPTPNGLAVLHRPAMRATRMGCCAWSGLFQISASHQDTEGSHQVTEGRGHRCGSVVQVQPASSGGAAKFWIRGSALCPVRHRVGARWRGFSRT